MRQKDCFPKRKWGKQCRSVSAVPNERLESFFLCTRVLGTVPRPILYCVLWRSFVLLKQYDKGTSKGGRGLCCSVDTLHFRLDLLHIDQMSLAYEINNHNHRKQKWNQHLLISGNGKLSSLLMINHAGSLYQELKSSLCHQPVPKSSDLKHYILPLKCFVLKRTCELWRIMFANIKI